MSRSLVSSAMKTNQKVVNDNNDQSDNEIILLCSTRRQRSCEREGNTKINNNEKHDDCEENSALLLPSENNNKNLEQDRKRSNFNRTKKQNNQTIKIPEETRDTEKTGKKSLRCLICFERAKEITSIVPKQTTAIIKNPSRNRKEPQESSFEIETHLEGLICNNTNRNFLSNNCNGDDDDDVVVDDEMEKQQHYFCSSCLSNDILLRWSKIEHEPGKIPEFFCPIPGCVSQRHGSNTLQKNHLHGKNNNKGGDGQDADNNDGMSMMMGPRQKSEITIGDDDDDDDGKNDQDRTDDVPPPVSLSNASETKQEATTFSIASIFVSLNDNHNNKINHNKPFASLSSSSSQTIPTSLPFTAIQIAKHCSEAAFLQYSQLVQNCRDAIILGAATDFAQTSIQQNRKSGDKLLLAAQLQLQFGSKAIMCPKCKLMTTWVECSDLKRHNGEVYRGRRQNNNNNNNQENRGVTINNNNNNNIHVVDDPNLRNVTAQTDNACKHCRFFTKYRAKWSPWDGILRDEDELLAAKDSWKDKEVDDEDEDESDDYDHHEEQEGQNNNNNNQNRPAPIRLTEEQKIQNFVDFSGTDQATAIDWLQRHGGDFDRAINGYLDSIR